MAFDPSQMSPPERLLWSYGVMEPGHIDLEAIAADRGAVVRYRRLDGCEARLVANGDRAVISINSESSEGRQRFSLAHELAHWIEDRHTGSYLCAKDDIGPQNAEKKSIESHANAYASQLVLPDYLVRPWINAKRVSLEVAAAMATDFNASLTAAAIKLAKRAATPACVACHSQTRLVWFQKNACFPDELFLTRELHEDTEAFRIAFAAASGMSRPKREPGERWFSGRDAYRVSVDSQSMKLPDGTALTLLALAK